jgi:hypothetical protein
MKFSNNVFAALLVTAPALGAAKKNQKNKVPTPALRLGQVSHQRRLASTFGDGSVCPSLPDDWAAAGWTDLLPPNDDGSAHVDIPFDFEMYGMMFNMFYVNTNGNISFNGPLSSFSSTGFPSGMNRMVAPFWADVDIRNGLGDVYGKVSGPWPGNTYSVAWDMVGYYSRRGDLRNTFQVMISDGTNPTMGLGNNVCFCYGDMQWTTGGASDGVDGFGGIPATVGMNEGDGILYTELGRYDTEAEVNTLDHTQTCFSVLVSVGISGDPHVKTWAGNYFDYHGECDLVLLNAPNFDDNGLDMDIHVRTRIRYDYSYIESAAIKIGNDIFEVGSFGAYSLNGVETPELEEDNGAMAGYTVHYHPVNNDKHIFEIVLGPNESITLSTHKDIVAVNINAGVTSKKYFENSSGIMGKFDGSLVARDGVTIMEDMNEFGQEWQVTDQEPQLFRDSTREPQFPNQCRLPSPGALEKRRLAETIPRDEAERACSHLTGSAKFENCVFDVMAVGDVDLANGYN